MKEEFVAISLAGLFGVLMMGGFAFDALYCLKASDSRGVIIDVVMFFLLGLMVRSDVRQTIPDGTYDRGWFVYERRQSKPKFEKAA